MKPELYEDFYNKLYNKNICLITKPKEYEKMHIFPNIYPEIEEDTAKMLIFKDVHQINTRDIKREFKKFMIKDFVKSVKGTDFPKCFDADISEEELKKQIEVFLKYRGSLMTGGICVKEFLPLKFYGSKSNEYRVFYMRNTVVSVSRNSGQPFYTPEVPNDITEKYSKLSSPFYTVDFAELEDGSWKIIEAGDGQVSGLSDNQNAETFYRALYLLTD